MSAMHAGVMTTSTEMMYAQLVTLIWCPIREPWTACTRGRGRKEEKQRKLKHTEIYEYACRARTQQWYSFYSRSSAVASSSQQATANRVLPTTAVPVPYQYMVGRLSSTVVGSGSAGRP